MTLRIRVASRRVQPSTTLAILTAATAAAIVAMTAPPALQAQDDPEDPLAIGSVADALEFRLIYARELVVDEGWVEHEPGRVR